MKFLQTKVLSLAALLAGASLGCSEETTAPPGGPSGELVISVAAPGEKTLAGGVVAVDGTLTAKGGAKAPTIVATSKGVEVGKGNAGAFSFQWDTTKLDAKGKPLYKDGNQCVTLSASASSGESASANRCVIVDNTLPVVTLTSPTDGGVAIGKLHISGHFQDANLGLITVRVDDVEVIAWCDKKAPAGDPANCIECKKRPGIRACLSGPGGFDFVMDYDGQPTKNVNVRAIAVDLRNQQAEASATAMVLKAPRYQTYRHNPAPDILGAKAIKTADLNGDGVIDAMIAAQNGLFAAYGETTEDGKALGRLGPAVRLVEGDVGLLGQTDIDGDGSLDHIAVGLFGGATKVAAWFSRKGGPQLAQEVPIPGLPKALAVGDVTKDGVADVVVGADEDAHALSILPIHTSVLCPTPKEPQRACKDVPAGEPPVSALVFAPRKGLVMAGDIASIAIGDFYSNDIYKDYPDIAVGRGNKGLMSVCRNSANGFEACYDTAVSSWVADMTDLKGLLAVDWNQDGQMDLIAGSSGAGVIRWLVGKGDGSFDFEPGKHRVFLAKFEKLAIEHLSSAAPAGGGIDVSAASLTILSEGREVLTIPVDPGNDLHVATCFRGHIVGGSIADIDPADITGDGKVDMVALDLAPVGVAVSPGRGDGTFEASEVLKVCGLPDTSWVFTNVEVSKFIFEDLTADGKPDLLIASKPGRARTESCPPLPGATGPSPLPAWHFALYANVGGKLDSFGRAGEFSPFFGKNKGQAGIPKQDPPREGCGDKMAEIAALKTGIFGNKTVGRDLAIAIDQDYPIGIPEAPDKLDSLETVNYVCTAREYYEIANHFGDKSQEPKEGSSKNPDLACKIYSPIDTKLEKPVTGFGNGAPWQRASLLIMQAGDPTRPYGMAAEAKPKSPVAMAATYAQSAGKRPIDMIVGPMNNDKIDDIATVMGPVSANTDKQHLASRVRYFRGDGTGRVQAVLFAEDSKQASLIGKDIHIEKQEPMIITTPGALDEWSFVNPDSKLITGEIKVTYRILPSAPFMAIGSGYCSSNLISVFAAGVGQTVAVRALGDMKFDRAVANSAVKDAKVLATGQMTSDNCTDVLYGGPSQFGFFAGTTSLFGPNSSVAIDPTAYEIAAVGGADVNQDKIFDLVVVDSKASRVEFYLGDGKGGFHRFQVPIAISPAGGALQQTDLDGDGCNEIAVAGLRGVTVLRSLGCAKP